MFVFICVCFSVGVCVYIYVCVCVQVCFSADVSGLYFNDFVSMQFASHYIFRYSD